MIPLKPDSMILLYFAFLFLSIVGAWVVFLYSKRKKRLLLFDQKLCMCEFCGHHYLERSENALHQCPQCGLYNKEN